MEHSTGLQDRKTAGQSTMISFEEAYDIVMNSAFRLDSETVSFTDSSGRILAQDVKSDMDMPPFDKSTVDGFACRKSDLNMDLTIAETIAAGQSPSKKIYRGECSRIMTGAPVPEGADCVVMVEDTEVLPTGKMKYRGSYSKSNISLKGEDVRKNEIVLGSGIYVRPQDIAIMASVGCTSVGVSKLPVVGIVSSGDELVEPDKKPGPSQIRNSNAYQLMAQVHLAGCPTKYYGIAGDDEQTTYNIVSGAVAECDLLLLTGGVSMGDFDFIPSVLERAGIKILFSGIRVQPGKPTTFGIHPECLVFGLPGNPVSSLIQFELLVKPLIYKMMGYEWKPFACELPLKEKYERRSGDRLGFIPVYITIEREVLPVDYHGSAHISSYSGAHGIIEIPVGKTQLEKGEIVSVRQI